ncbi:2-amino-4-hydroxy-6-hydroxymethyldihydropteridine diphosphokinase [Cumulibacter soli]|uniref:2-amino-4-hydroxy-6- hydroxymethyldihydropteridine diphosphokinase n=1 Tax=Cumulibacter soli TaxID=2546344 RepID=UPI00106871B4|nr:2-amino-4-hydroxy-6-hydroxymethyldihydropteridine diphosphokinase [Cumulibacter soli]
MSRAVLSIGSNVGDSLGYLRSVVRALGVRLESSSGVYRTAPWGGVEQQPFLNAVLIASDDSLDGYGWLRFGQSCEQAAERTRDVRWGPRTLDVDVIAVYSPDLTRPTGEPPMVLQSDPELTLPHPRAFERAFVLAPWHEVAPDAQLPQGPVADLLAGLQASGAADQAAERLDQVAL